MANPAADLFNDASLNAAWTVNLLSGGSVVEEGPTGIRCARVVSGINGNFVGDYQQPNGAKQSEISQVLAGDFDVAIVVEPQRIGFESRNGVAIGLGAAWTPTGRLASRVAWRGNSGIGIGLITINSLNGTSGSEPPSYYANRARAWVIRVARVGATVTFYVPYYVGSPGTWASYFSDASQGDTLFIGAAGWSANQFAVNVLAILPLVNGVLAAPAAPTGGVAFSAPKPDDSNLGVAFAWAAAPANVARRAEVQTALDSGFTSSVRDHRFDDLMDGETLEVRRGGRTAGQTVYARARFVDELNQPGAWSTTVSATAAVYPSIVPSFTSPVGPFHLEALHFTVS